MRQVTMITICHMRLDSGINRRYLEIQFQNSWPTKIASAFKASRTNFTTQACQERKSKLDDQADSQFSDESEHVRDL